MVRGGFSRERLSRMHGIMAGYVERGAVPGLLSAVSRRGEVHVDVIGTMSPGGSTPIQQDSLFRISSMTKPIAAVGAMILVEECLLRLDEPVDHLLPELANRQVLKRLDGPLDETVPANRPITLRDLLTFRLGFGLVMVWPESYPIQKAVSGLIPGFFDRHGWGFCLSIDTRRDDLFAIPGRYGWDGGMGTVWRSDPRDEMVTILMTSQLWSSPNPPNLVLDFWTSAYQAIDD